MAACNFLQDDNAMCPIFGIKLYILYLCGILSLCLYCIDRIDCKRRRRRRVQILVMVQVSRAPIVLRTRRITPTMKACGTECRRPSWTATGGALEGEEGTELVTYEGAPIDNEAKKAESSQNTMGTSSTNVVANMGTQVFRPQYFLLLGIDGFLMWQ